MHRIDTTKPLGNHSNILKIGMHFKMVWPAAKQGAEGSECGSDDGARGFVAGGQDWSQESE